MDSEGERVGVKMNHSQQNHQKYDHSEFRRLRHQYALQHAHEKQRGQRPPNGIWVAMVWLGYVAIFAGGMEMVRMVMVLCGGMGR